MPLPIDFVASATALECYEYCPRRFQHRYLDHLPTAGPDKESAARMERGSLFHRLVLWDDLGLDTSLILDSAADPLLAEQWSAYQSFRETQQHEQAPLQHDVSLTASCGGIPVMAKIDALRIDPAGGVTIYDWKTSEQPNTTSLHGSPQSKVYPYVVWEVLGKQPGTALTQPEQIRFVYWFPSHPGLPHEIQYSSDLLVSGSEWLGDLLATITSDDVFEMTTDRARCQRCAYIAHCGVRPEEGDLPPLDEDYYVPVDTDAESFDHELSSDR